MQKRLIYLMLSLFFSPQLVNAQKEDDAEKIGNNLSNYFLSPKKVQPDIEFEKDAYIIDSTLARNRKLSKDEYLIDLAFLKDILYNFSLSKIDKIETFKSDKSRNIYHHIYKYLRTVRLNNVQFQDTAYVYITNSDTKKISKIEFSNSGYVNPHIYWKRNTAPIDTLLTNERISSVFIKKQKQENMIFSLYKDCSYRKYFKNFFTLKDAQEYKMFTAKELSSKENRFLKSQFKEIQLLSVNKSNPSFFRNRFVNMSFGLIFCGLGIYAMQNGSKQYLESSGTKSYLWPGVSAFACYSISGAFMYRSFFQEYEKELIFSTPETNDLFILRIRF